MFKSTSRLVFAVVILALFALLGAALVSAQETTEVGTPRATTLIVDNLGGRVNKIGRAHV